MTMQWTATAADIGHILLVRLDNMGDVIMCTPAMQAVRQAHPQARLTLLTSPSGARLMPHLDMLDDVIVHRASWVKQPSPDEVDDDAALVQRLRDARIDMALLFTTATQSPLPIAMLCRMGGIAHRIAHCRENPYELLTVWVRETDVVAPGMRHEVQRQLDLVAQAGMPPPVSPRLRLAVHEPDRQVASRLLIEAGVAPGQAYVLVHPGATAASRRYPPADFGAAVDELAHAGWTCVFCGGDEDRHAVREARAAMTGRSVDLTGRMPLGVLIALIEQASLLIANNSGPSHIAAAVGTPVVCLYALTNPQHMPWQVPARVLFHDVPCRNCLRSVCPEGHHACLRGVVPAQVSEAAFALLEVAGSNGQDEIRPAAPAFVPNGIHQENKHGSCSPV